MAKIKTAYDRKNEELNRVINEMTYEINVLNEVIFEMKKTFGTMTMTLQTLIEYLKSEGIYDEEKFVDIYNKLYKKYMENYDNIRQKAEEMEKNDLINSDDYANA